MCVQAVYCIRVEGMIANNTENCIWLKTKQEKKNGMKFAKYSFHILLPPESKYDILFVSLCLFAYYMDCPFNWVMNHDWKNSVSLVVYFFCFNIPYFTFRPQNLFFFFIFFYVIKAFDIFSNLSSSSCVFKNWVRSADVPIAYIWNLL